MMRSCMGDRVSKYIPLADSTRNDRKYYKGAPEDEAILIERITKEKFLVLSNLNQILPLNLCPYDFHLKGYCNYDSF